MRNENLGTGRFSRLAISHETEQEVSLLLLLDITAPYIFTSFISIKINQIILYVTYKFI